MSDIIGEVDSLKALDLNPPNREEPLLSRVHVNQQVIYSLVRWIIVKHVGKCDPSDMPLAHDIGLARLPLSIERIEFLLEPLVGRFAGVDRAADGEPGSRGINPGHGLFSRLN